MNTAQEERSLWNRLGQRHDFYDTLNAPVNNVITAIMDLEHYSGNTFYPGTAIDIRPDSDGYQFRIAINERHTHVVASGRLWQDNVTHWEGSIRNGWRYVWLSLYLMVLGGLLLVSLLSSPIQFEWPKLMFACGCLFVGVFILFFLPVLGRNRMKKELVQILDMFNTQ